MVAGGVIIRRVDMENFEGGMSSIFSLWINLMLFMNDLVISRIRNPG
jgi:hypothetical protein